MAGFAMVLVFTATVPFLISAQTSEQCSIHEIVNLDGWKVPGTSKAMVTRHARWTTGGMRFRRRAEVR
jgi:hypothetical protein